MSEITPIQSAKKKISIKGARVHNLKNIDVEIPHNKFVVITGVSGSGKSSLAFDTIYAEGQRRYVESLSSYARQFLGKMHKPEVDYIHGIAPAIAIEQKVISRSSRSTVGTSTEIYDYLKLLFARIGKTFSPVSGNLVKKQSVSDVVNYINTLKNETQVTILAPLKAEKNLHEQLAALQKQGFSRVEIDGELKKIDEIIGSEKSEVRSHKINKQSKISNLKSQISNLFLVIDRFTVEKGNEENESRIADSVQTAFYEGKGECIVHLSPSPLSLRRGDGGETKFSNRFELDGITFEEPSVHLFTFNNPVGACRTCGGFGSTIGLDENLIVPNKNLSVFDGAIACWKGEKMGEWKEELVKNAHKFDFPIHRPFNQLSEEEKKLLWTGNEHFNGMNDFFKFVEGESYKIQYRVMLHRYRGKTLCPECKGTRLRKESMYVKVAEKSIGEIVSMQVKDSLFFFKDIQLDENEKQIAKRLLIEIINRLQFLDDVGLGYLTLNRMSNSLSGGESQRINLATSLGSSLVGSMYILDEPSIGLHPRDTQRLIKVLKSLRDVGNTVIVVEHDEEIMRAADEIIDLGPGAGTNGGEVVFQGKAPFYSPKGGSNEIHSSVFPPSGVLRGAASFTLDYLTGKENIPLPKKRRKWKNFIELTGANENNLKNLTVKFPLNTFTVVTGVSGSGKTSLIKKVLYPAMKADYPGNFSSIGGDRHKIMSAEMIDQNPIGKSSRSNPVTYIKAYDDIRNLFAELPLARMRGYRPSTFSFNVDGGRCEECDGEGEVTIEMQFMADVHLLCETCKGKRFKDDVLEIEYPPATLGTGSKNIADVLEMTVDEAVEFFQEEKGKHTSVHIKHLSGKLKLLQDVGMGYVKLGQSSSTLSGGEAQRVKLATFLSPPSPRRGEQGVQPPPYGGIKVGLGMASSLFIFDEPTTGLHFHDIKKLLYALNRLVDEGNTLIVIEHNPDVIKCADWVIDLGPEGGDAGGNIVFEGTPEGLIKCESSITGKFLKGKVY